ncbi:MAG: response regulator [Deltaproteobacteria bacterium]|nr:response regulator [Deltaproteobacteria bacterium]
MTAMLSQTISQAISSAGFLLLAWAFWVAHQSSKQGRVDVKIPLGVPIAFLAGGASFGLAAVAPIEPQVGFVAAQTFFGVVTAAAALWSFVTVNVDDSEDKLKLEPEPVDVIPKAMAELVGESKPEPGNVIPKAMAELVDESKPEPVDVIPKAMAEFDDELHHQLTQLEDDYLKTLRENERLSQENEDRIHEFAVFSQELRTPLSMMLSHSKMLGKRVELDDDLRRDIAYLTRTSQLLLSCVDDLVVAVRQEESEHVQQNLQSSNVDVARLVKLCASQFLYLAEERGCVFSVDADEPIFLSVDVRKIERVVLNLLFNAFKLTPTQGHIRCSVRGMNDGVIIEVADSGPGVPLEAREEIFSSFHNSGDNRRFGGTGLSLSLSRSFVELHRGHMRCDESVNGGAKFTVTLPRNNQRSLHDEFELDETGARRIARLARDELQEEAEESGIKRSSLKVLSKPHRGSLLLVEDNREMSRLIRRCLEDEYEVAWCHEANEALDKMDIVNPDLVIFNASLPGNKDDGFVSQLRSIDGHSHTPVLVLTLPEDGERRIQLLQSGAQDFLAKPFLVEELLTRVENLVTNKRVRDLLTSEVESSRNDLELIAKEVKVSLDETRVARDLAEHAKLVKDNFLRIMSHELRTPITSMQISIRRLTRPGRAASLDDRQLECIDDIGHGCRRLQETVDTIMEYARLESGRMKLKLRDFRLEDLLEEVRHDFAAHARQKGLDLSLTVIGEHTMHSDPNIVRLLAVNLIGNAVKYTESGSVDIVAESSSEGHVIEVRDTGRGISDEDLPTIFEPFEQLQSPRFEKGVGSGLGLAIVKQMVLAIDGEIKVRSLLNGGSAFTLLLKNLCEEKKDTALSPQGLLHYETNASAADAT